jgi:hypothetical protein
MNKVTRREFLEGASATVLVTTSAYGQEEPAGPHFAITLNGFAVRWSGKDIFTLRPDSIVPGAKALYSTDKTLTIARADGVDRRRVDFVLKPYKENPEQWLISATWQFAGPQISSASSYPPGKSIGSKMPPITVTSAVPLPKSPAAVIFRATLGSGQPAALVDRLIKSSRQAPARGIRHTDKQQLACPRQAVLVFDTGSQETGLPAEAGQQFSAFTDFSGHRLMLAPLPEEMSVRLINEKPTALVDIAADKCLQLQLQAAKHATASFGQNDRLSLEGPVELLVHSPRCETTRIPCHFASRASAAGGQTWTVKPTRDFWRLNTRARRGYLWGRGRRPLRIYAQAARRALERNLPAAGEEGDHRASKGGRSAR